MNKLTPEELARRAEQRAERKKQLAEQLAQWKKEQAEKLAQKEKQKAEKRAEREKQRAEADARWKKQRSEDEAAIQVELYNRERFPPRKIVICDDCVRIDGRWYWGWGYEFSKELWWYVEVERLSEVPMEWEHLLPAPVEEEKDSEYDDRAEQALRDSLPTLTIHAFEPMPEDLARS